MVKFTFGHAMSVFALGFAALAPAAWAQSLPLDAEVPTPGVEYDSSIPTPEAVLDFELGSRHTRPSEIVRYFERVAAVSPRVEVRQHGYSVEGRPLIHAVVTRPQRFDELEAIRKRQLAELQGPSEDRQREEDPIVVWMGYGVHGNESSAHEAPLLLLYWLAAGRGEPVQEALDELIVIIDPNMNPDGHDRFVDWVNGQRGRNATTDPQDREHRTPWPSGRTNHYLFDLNRDWLLAVHPESRARLELWHAWRPHFHTDFHEMGGSRTFFFQPGIPSRTNPGTPPRVRRLTRDIAEYHARAFDRVAQPYFTRESFDDYYYGKGSTYPDVQGSVGILFEQGSSRGLKAETSWGPLHYRRCIRNQTIASLSSLRAAVELREEFRANRLAFVTEALTATEGAQDAWHIPFAGQRTRAELLGQLLRRHGIEVCRLGDGLRVPIQQPQGRLLATLMEPVREVPDTTFYDVSAWTMPLAYSLEVERVSGSEAGAAEPTEELSLTGGTVRPGSARAGWFLGWNRFFAPKALAALHAEGVLTRLVTQAIVLRGLPERRIEPGAIYIPAAQPEIGERELRSLIDRLAEEHAVVFTPAEQGRSSSGPDLGSPGHEPVRAANVALLAGPGTRTYRVGEFWHHLDVRLGLAVSLIDAIDLERLDLGRYDVICVPGGRYGSVSDRDAAALRDWVRDGGTLIAVDSASRWLDRAEIGDCEVESGFIAVEGETYAVRRARRARHRVAGAFFELKLDTSHPLAFGLEPRLAVFRVGTHVFTDDRDPAGTVVGRYSRRPLRSGYSSKERVARLSERPSLVVEREGRGRIVHMLDSILFRGTMLGSARLIANAIYFREAY